ncbi:uncharacterized protein LOC110839942 isoform X2 [Zootermopsis nevadensis]|uniref:Small ribosomal subunit protein mS38 n=1 Tax=Zootermopsis nevadensis TaxID=136037 RepID=A0A067QH60_ZOONE|nr:uncharacterized protein LOC110839942 isoform X2 [Zootermopsis nevadensis]KDR07801.1 hypothetical protein L798_02431 [Zootermopsis nevadensis]
MLIIQKALNRSFSISRFICLGICHGHKYMHSSSTEFKINYDLLPCSKDYGSFQFTNGIQHKTEPVKLYSTSQRMSTVQLAHWHQLDLSDILNKYKARIELPVASTVNSFKLPPVRDIIITHYDPKHIIEAPTKGGLVEKQAARLIVIRRRKMKKHKLKKLRKKMKFEWAKVRQRRELRKEKAFQAQLIAQIKEAEKFDAEKYVAERLHEAHKVPLPRTWRGKRLPFFIIKEKLGIK